MLRILLLVLGAVALPAAAQQAAVWTLSPEPLLHIGTVSGDPAYELGIIVDADWLSGGGVVAADGQTKQLRYFDAGGRARGTAGRAGGGPGEFRWLVPVFVLPGDSVLAADWGRFNLYAPGHEFVRTVPPDTARDRRPVAGTDTWLHRQFWIDGGSAPPDQARVRAALDALPAPDAQSGYRYVRVAPDGYLWIREPLAGRADYRWTILGLDGQARAVLTTPAVLDIYRLGAERILGRWRGEDDVNFVRAHRVLRTSESAALPGWLVSSTRPPDPDPRRLAERVEVVRTALREIVTAQERFFADHRTYTADAAQLEWEAPDGVRLDIIRAGGTGWAGVAADPAFGLICGMAVGIATPRGWNEGQAVCSARTER